LLVEYLKSPLMYDCRSKTYDTDQKKTFKANWLLQQRYISFPQITQTTVQHDIILPVSTYSQLCIENKKNAPKYTQHSIKMGQFTYLKSVWFTACTKSCDMKLTPTRNIKFAHDDDTAVKNDFARHYYALFTMLVRWANDIQNNTGPSIRAFLVADKK